MKTKVFYVQELPPEHTVGDVICKGCHTGWGPAVCKCGGLIHRDNLGENKTTVFSASKCDRCGYDFEILPGWLTQETMDTRMSKYKEREKKHG